MTDAPADPTDAPRRVAVVTGANRGIGLAVVRALAASGDTVVLRQPRRRRRRAGRARRRRRREVLVRRLDVTEPATWLLWPTSWAAGSAASTCW